jgi:hypothetical protein
MDLESKKYFNSKETIKELKISSCDLMHIRTKEEIEYIKKGNAYFYNVSDLEI